MLLVILINVFFLISARGQLCSADNRIDLTNSEIFKDGSIVESGIRFPPNYIFSLNVSGDLRTYGCPCEFRKCFHKCCPLGQVMYNRSCVEMDDLIMKEGLQLYYMDTYRRSVNLSTSEKFAILTGIPCDGDVYKEDDGKWYVQEDGKLYVETPVSIDPWMVFDPDNYCIDTFVTEENGEKISKLDALACFMTTEKVNYIPSITCMLISCVFILVTVAVYIFLPELCNLHGKVLISYLLSIFVGFIFLSTMQILLTIDNISITCCLVFTFIIYYFLLAAFFWLNVMSFDIWWTFSGNRGVLIERMSVQTRFRAYCLYAFGLPTVLTILLAALEFSNLPFHPLLPLLRQLGCFINGTSRLLYLYGPIVILCLANAVFFTLTAIKIRKIKKETSVLKSKESATHDKRNNDKQRLCLYLKLFAVMGINWLLEVISSIYPEANKVWKFTDAYNVLVGLMIFILFVCKRKIFRLLKKRIKETFDRRSTELRNTSQTYASRNNHIDIRQSTHSQAMKTSNGKNTINTTPV